MKIPHWLAIAGALVVWSVQAAEVPPPEKLLPDTTLAVLTVPNYPAADAWYNNSPGGKFLDDPAMKPFMDKLKGKFRKDVVEPLEKELGIKFADYEGLAQGQITLAITAAGWQGTSDKMPAFLMLMDTGSKSSQLKQNLAALRKKWQEADKPLKEEKVGGAEFTTFTLMTDDLRTVIERVFPDPNAGWETITPNRPGAPPRRQATRAENRPVHLTLGQSDTLFIVGTSLSEIRKIVELQTGQGGKALAEVPTFKADYARLFRDAQYFGWVNVKLLVELAMKGVDPAAGGGANNPMGVNPVQVVNALGLNGAETAAVALQGDKQGATVQFFLGVPEKARKGLFKLLSPMAGDTTPPPFVPRDAVKYTRIRYNFSEGWSTIEQTLNDINPGLLGALAFFESGLKQQNPNFTLRKGLIELLGDDIITYEFKPTGQTLEALSTAPGLVLIGSPAPEKLLETVKGLFNNFAQMRGPRGGRRDAEPTQLKTREFQGVTIYTFPPTPQMNFRGERIGERSLNLCASGKYLVFSYDNGVLEQFLRNAKAARPLSGVAGLNEAAQKAGGLNTGMFHYEDQTETMRFLFNVLRKEGSRIGELLAMTPLGGRLGFADDSKAFQEWFDFTLLPPFEKVSRYVGITVYTGAATPEGLLIKAYTPNPPGFK
ncbi:MAG: hypothetical protein N3J91_10510 [Verrucomicrobiae bacterium]|nr:hypothetical protein [Verrucomicrobiae bacterium]